MSKGSGSTRSNAKLSSRDSATLSLNEKLGKYESYAKAQGSTMNEFSQGKYAISYGLKINGNQTYISELTNKEAYGDQTGKFRFGTKNYDTFEEAYKAAERKLGAPKNNSAQPQPQRTQTQSSNNTARQQTTESKPTSRVTKEKISQITRSADTFKYLASNGKDRLDFNEEITVTGIKNGVANVSMFGKAYGDSYSRQNTYTYNQGEKRTGYRFLPGLGNGSTSFTYYYAEPNQQLANHIINEAKRRGLKVNKVVMNRYYD